MPIIHYKGQKLEAAPGDNLRKVLLKHGLSPYNGKAKYLNCRGLGSCGTCAVEIKTAQSGHKTFMEKWRLAFPPHKAGNTLRLACQCSVEADMEVIKHPGFWGEK